MLFEYKFMLYSVVISLALFNLSLGKFWKPAFRSLSGRDEVHDLAEIVRFQPSSCELTEPSSCELAEPSSCELAELSSCDLAWLSSCDLA